MKKILTLALCFAMLLTAAACGGGSGPDKQEAKPADTMDLSEMFKTILKDVPDLPECMEMELDSETFQFYAFTDYIEGVKAVASEAMINITPHSAVLIRLPEGSDVQAVAKSVEENANTAKWVCVEAETKIVRSHNNTILLVMSAAKTAEAIANNFDALWA